MRLCFILSPPLPSIKCITVVPKVDEQVTFKAHQMQTFRKCKLGWDLSDTVSLICLWRSVALPSGPADLEITAYRSTAAQIIRHCIRQFQTFVSLQSVQ